MGIPGYYGQFITKRVKQAIIYGLPPIVSSLAFDLNGVFHAAKSKVYGEITTSTTDPRLLLAISRVDPSQSQISIQNAIEEILLAMIRSTKPKDCLILCVDGPGPAAKLSQQKGRREKNARGRSLIEVFDGNSITPGTDFMQKIDAFMTTFIAKHRDELPPKVIYSSHLVPGEGEHKIMDIYRNGGVLGGNNVHVLYGLDADLIMLSLLSPVNHIYLARETVKESINIDTFKGWLYDTLQTETAIDDFIVIMTLLGNDFIPHQPSLTDLQDSVDDLIELYITEKLQLTINDGNSRRINWENMKVIFEKLYGFERDYKLPKRAAKSYEYPSKIFQQAIEGNRFIYDRYVTAWYINALSYRGQSDYVNSLLRIAANYQPTYHDYLVDSKLSQKTVSDLVTITDNQIEDMVIAYCRTIEWVYLYYRQGTFAINHDWYYPYYHCPLFKDCARFTPKEIIGYTAYPGMTIFNVLQQLVAVLPLKSINLLPQELKPLFGYNSPIRDFYPTDFIVEMDGMDSSSHKGKVIPPNGVPIVPFVDRRRIVEAVQQMPFTIERVIEYLPAEAQVFIRDRNTQDRILAQRFEKELIQSFDNDQQKFRDRRETNKPEPSNFRGRGRDRNQAFRGRGRGTTIPPSPSYNSYVGTRGGSSSNLSNVQQFNLPATTFNQPIGEIPILSVVPIDSDFSVNVGKIESDVGTISDVKQIDIAGLQNRLGGQEVRQSKQLFNPSTSYIEPSEQTEMYEGFEETQRQKELYKQKGVPFNPEEIPAKTTYRPQESVKRAKSPKQVNTEQIPAKTIYRPKESANRAKITLGNIEQPSLIEGEVSGEVILDNLSTSKQQVWQNTDVLM